MVLLQQIANLLKHQKIYLTNQSFIMKVRCISGHDHWQVVSKWYKKHWWSKPVREQVEGPKKGDVLTVLQSIWYSGKEYYMLKEWPNQGFFDAREFVPLDEKFEEVKFSQIKEKASVN